MLRRKAMVAMTAIIITLATTACGGKNTAETENQPKTDVEATETVNEVPESDAKGLVSAIKSLTAVKPMEDFPIIMTMGETEFVEADPLTKSIEVLVPDSISFDLRDNMDDPRSAVVYAHQQTEPFEAFNVEVSAGYDERKDAEAQLMSHGVECLNFERRSAGSYDVFEYRGKGNVDNNYILSIRVCDESVPEEEESDYVGIRISVAEEGLENHVDEVMEYFDKVVEQIEKTM